MQRMVVDLPEPFGPRKPVTTPSGTVKDRSSTANFEPYFLLSRSTVIMSSMMPVETASRSRARSSFGLPPGPPSRHFTPLD